MKTKTIKMIISSCILILLIGTYTIGNVNALSSSNRGRIERTEIITIENLENKDEIITDVMQEIITINDTEYRLRNHQINISRTGENEYTIEIEMTYEEFDPFPMAGRIILITFGALAIIPIIFIFGRLILLGY